MATLPDVVATVIAVRSAGSRTVREYSEWMCGGSAIGTASGIPPGHVRVSSFDQGERLGVTTSRQAKPTADQAVTNVHPCGHSTTRPFERIKAGTSGRPQHLRGEETRRDTPPGQVFRLTGRAECNGSSGNRSSVNPAACKPGLLRAVRAPPSSVAKAGRHESVCTCKEDSRDEAPVAVGGRRRKIGVPGYFMGDG